MSDGLKSILRKAAFAAALALGLTAGGAQAATLYISEFATGVSTIGSQQAQVYPQSALTDQTVALTGSSAQSAAFNAKTHAVTLTCDIGCSVLFGSTTTSNPVATTTNFLLQQGVAYYFAVTPGTKVAAIANTAGNAPGSGSSGPVFISGYDSGVISAAATPANSSHAAGTSVGGLFSLAIARTAGGSGIITNFNLKSVGGSTGAYVARVWQKSPANSTCTDNVAFAGSDTDDAFLITSPFSITPSAPASTTGDTATYASSQGLTWDYKNVDTSPGQNVYVCLVTVATDTADQNKIVRLQVSGPQN